MDAGQMHSKNHAGIDERKWAATYGQWDGEDSSFYFLAAYLKIFGTKAKVKTNFQFSDFSKNII